MTARAGWYRAVGRYDECIADAEVVVNVIAMHDSISHQDAKASFHEAVEAAFAIGNLTKVDALLGVLDAVPFGVRPLSMEAHAARFRARLAHARGDDAARRALLRACRGDLRELALPFRLAIAQLEHAEWLATQARDADAAPLRANALATFQRLEAHPWVARAPAAPVNCAYAGGRCSASLSSAQSLISSL